MRGWLGVFKCCRLLVLSMDFGCTGFCWRLGFWWSFTGLLVFVLLVGLRLCRFVNSVGKFL